MIEELKNVLRFKLHQNCHILVNDLSEVIDEVSTFVKNKVEPHLKESNERIVSSGVELLYENDKLVWKLFDNDFTNVLTLDIFNVEHIFKGKEEYMIEIKQKYEHYPKEFYGKSLVCFMEALASIVYGDELIEEEINVFDICLMGNNGKNNIIYEI